MKADRIRNVSRNFTWGMFQRIASSVFPFITRTVRIYTTGLSYVGLSGLFSSVLMVLNLAELGIGSAMVYFMYKKTCPAQTASYDRNSHTSPGHMQTVRYIHPSALLLRYSTSSNCCLSHLQIEFTARSVCA